jgi:CDP-diacylglycerol--serine O-phosphatidyltransferase
VQLDSLADLISFGVAPALLVHQWVLQDLGSAGLIISFLFLAAGAARLARFNVMSARGDNPSDAFVGLSIPLAAVALVSLVIAGVKLQTNAVDYVNYIAVYILVIAALQVSTVRFRSFKNLQLSTQSLVGGIIALGAPIGIAVWMKQPWLMLVFFSGGYILWGITEHVLSLFTSTSKQSPTAQNAD